MINIFPGGPYVPNSKHITEMTKIENETVKFKRICKNSNFEI